MKQEVIRSLIIGLLALLFLIILLSPSTFSTWFADKTVVYTISFFFFVPIVKIIMKGRYNKAYTVPILLGLIVLIPYAILTNLTLYDITITLLETTVVIAFYTTIFHLIEEEL